MLDINSIRADFPMLQQEMSGKPLIYFDNSATTFKPQPVIDAVNHSYTSLTSNIHRGDYQLAYETDQAYDHCRETIAKMINCASNEVVYTSGDTASLNIVAYGYGLKFLHEGDVILSTLGEHASNILPWFRVCQQTGAVIEYIPFDEEGRVTIDAVKSVMSDKVKVVAIASVGNTLGYLAPIKEICEIAHQYGAIVVVDGAQSVPHMPTDVQDWDCDFLTFSSHKMCGPSGVGILYGKYQLLDEMDAVFLGGGSNARFNSSGYLLLVKPPVKFEAGTPNIEGVLGLDAASQYLMNIGFDNIRSREIELSKYLLEEVEALDNVIVYNHDPDTAILSFNVKDIFAQDTGIFLANQRIAERCRNHCAK